jgi:hypothetical protein
MKVVSRARAAASAPCSPLTGASSTAKPRSSSPRATRVIVSGCTVLCTSTVAPGAMLATRPPSPWTTDSSWASVPTTIWIASHELPSSASEVAILAPRFARRSSGSRRVSKATVWKPAASALAAIGSPMLPIPTTPMHPTT